MKFVTKLCMFVFTCIAVYSAPTALMPYGDEVVVRKLSLLVIYEALALVGMFFGLYHFIKWAEEDEEKEQNESLDTNHPQISAIGDRPRRSHLSGNGGHSRAGA